MASASPAGGLFHVKHLHHSPRSGACQGRGSVKLASVERVAGPVEQVPGARRRSDRPPRPWRHRRGGRRPVAGRPRGSPSGAWSKGSPTGGAVARAQVAVVVGGHEESRAGGSQKRRAPGHWATARDHHSVESRPLRSESARSADDLLAEGDVNDVGTGLVPEGVAGLVGALRSDRWSTGPRWTLLMRVSRPGSWSDCDRAAVHASDARSASQNAVTRRISGRPACAQLTERRHGRCWPALRFRWPRGSIATGHWQSSRTPLTSTHRCAGGCPPRSATLDLLHRAPELQHAGGACPAGHRPLSRCCGLQRRGRGWGCRARGPVLSAPQKFPGAGRSAPCGPHREEPDRADRVRVEVYVDIPALSDSMATSMHGDRPQLDRPTDGNGRGRPVGGGRVARSGTPRVSGRGQTSSVPVLHAGPAHRPSPSASSRGSSGRTVVELGGGSSPGRCQRRSRCARRKAAMKGLRWACPAPRVTPPQGRGRTWWVVGSDLVVRRAGSRSQGGVSWRR